VLKILHAECEKLGYKPRVVQIEAINWLESVWNSKNICKVISIPVAGGKSMIAKTIGEYNKKRGGLTTAIVTPQNLLIDQYISEFSDLNYFKGKQHYKCDLTKTTCEDGLEFEKISKKKCKNCPYRAAKDKCYYSPITIFNPISYYILPKVQLTENGYISLYDIDTMVIDEVQSLPGMLRDLTTIKIWSHDIKWESGVSSSILGVINLLNLYSNKLTTYIMNKNFNKKERVKFRNFQKKVDFLISQLDKNGSYFLCEEIIDRYRNEITNCLIIRPKYVTPSICAHFFKNIKRIVLMTGTAFPYIWKELGFDNVDYIDLPSPIPRERRFIFVTNSININSKIVVKKERDDMLNDLVEQIRYIVEIFHAKENGVILLPYNLAEELKYMLHEEYYWHMDKNTKADRIEEFKKNTSYKVGVFSGSYEGISLNDEISRFTIIPKVAYANLLDTVVKVRMQEHPDNYALETIATIIQASGRSTRTETDYSTIYILDSNFLRLYAQTKTFLPKYFKEALLFKKPDVAHLNLLNTFREIYENDSIT